MIFLLLVFLLSFSQFSESNEEITTFILVRHAETLTDGTQDPGLSKVGLQRARSLAAHLEATDITAIYSTPFNRTRETVSMIAETKGLSVQEYSPFDPKALSKILTQNKGVTIFIVGHSNTTPGMVNQLIGENRFEQLSESDYDNIYIVMLTEIGTGKVAHLRY